MWNENDRLGENVLTEKKANSKWPAKPVFTLALCLLVMATFLVIVQTPGLGMHTLSASENTTFNFYTASDDHVELARFEMGRTGTLTAISFRITPQTPVTTRRISLRTIANNSGIDGLKDADIIEVDSRGRAWVIDWYNEVITRSSDSTLSGIEEVVIEGLAWGDGITGIAITPNDDAWILTIPKNKLFLIDGTTLKVKQDVQLDHPAWDVEADSSGAAWVPDYTNNSLIRATKTGAKTRFPLPEGMINPTSIEIDGSDRVWFVAEKIANMSSKNNTYEVWWGRVLTFLEPGTGSFTTVKEGSDNNVVKLLDIDVSENALLYGAVINNAELGFGILDTQTLESQEFPLPENDAVRLGCVFMEDAKLSPDNLIWHVEQRPALDPNEMGDACFKTHAGIVGALLADNGSLVSEFYEDNRFKTVKSIGIGNDGTILLGGSGFVTGIEPLTENVTARAASASIGLPQAAEGLTFFEDSGMEFDIPRTISMSKEAISWINSYVRNNCDTSTCYIYLGFSAGSAGRLLVSNFAVEGENVIPEEELEYTAGTDEYDETEPVLCNYNALCEPALGEDYNSCPRDCEEPDVGDEETIPAGWEDTSADSAKQAANRFLIALLIVLLVGVTLSVLFVSAREKKRKKVDEQRQSWGKQ